MDNELALTILERNPALTTSERLQAARFLAQNADKAHHNRLSGIRESESNPWVHQALDQALQRSGEPSLISSVTTIEEIA